jgi:hypothetical protein
LGKLTATVPGVFKLIQGGPGWKARYADMDSEPATQTAAAAVRDLIGTITALRDEATLEQYYDEVSYLMC